MSYPIPAHACETCYEIKKSRFLARIVPVTDRAAAMNALELAKQTYPDARHHCWAYQIGPPHSPRLVALSDDGEPGGTAGKPILNVIQHKNVGDIMLIVTRYFGGIKLGAGGLVRAYSQAAQQVFDTVTLAEHRELEEIAIQCDYASEQWLRHQIGLIAGEIRTVDFAEEVTLTVALASDQIPGLRATLGQGRGRILD